MNFNKIGFVLFILIVAGCGTIPLETTTTYSSGIESYSRKTIYGRPGSLSGPPATPIMQAPPVIDGELRLGGRPTMFATGDRWVVQNNVPNSIIVALAVNGVPTPLRAGYSLIPRLAFREVGFYEPPTCTPRYDSNVDRWRCTWVITAKLIRARMDPEGNVFPDKLPNGEYGWMGCIRKEFGYNTGSGEETVPLEVWDKVWPCKT